MEVKRSCTQQQFVAARIKPMITNAKLTFTNGSINWFIGNWTNDLEKHEQILVFKDLFRHYEYINYPLQYNSVKKESEAYIKIYFVAKDGNVYCEGGKQFKCPFEISDDTLAVAYAPYGGEWQGFVFINDNLFWSLRKNEKGKHQLFETLVHELGHTHNMDHSTKPTSVMYWQEGENQSWDNEANDLMFKIYGKDRYEILKKTYSGALLFNVYKKDANEYISKRIEEEYTEPKNKGCAWVVTLYALVVIVAFIIAFYLVKK